MRKDILFLSQFFYPEHNSSATLPLDTAKYLVKNGYSVDVLCGYPKEYYDGEKVPLRETVDGIGIRRIRYIQVKRVKKLGRLVNYFSFTAGVLLHGLLFKKYDVIIVYTNPPILPIAAMLGKWLFGCKIIFVAYDIYPEVAYVSGNLRPGSLIDKTMRWINRKLYKNADTVVALTDEMREFIIANRPQITPEKVVTISNWAHEDHFTEEHCDFKWFGYRGDEFVVSYLGNMGICQEMDTLISAARKIKGHPRIRFLFAGHGSKKELVKAELAGNANVQILDFLNGDDFLRSIAVSSCYVLTLGEGLTGTAAPSKYYSYLQGGKPVIVVTERHSYLTKEITEQKIGYAVEIGAVDELIETILMMSENPEQASQMGERAALLYKREYDKPLGLAKYEAIVRRMCSKEQTKGVLFMSDCLFCKIIEGEVPGNKIYEDELCYAFYDIAPQAPVHFLVVPKTHIQSVSAVTEESAPVVGHIFAVIAKLADELGFSAPGYRVVSNIGQAGQQTVPHLHFHVLAGRDMTWPPG